MREQFERRQREQFGELLEAMDNVDVGLFTEESGTSGSAPVFELRGALPPTTTVRCSDGAGAAAIGKSEKQAAKELIARRREAERPRPVGAAARHLRPSTALTAGTEGSVAAGHALSRTSSCSSCDSPEAPRRSPRSTKNWELGIAAFHRQAEQSRDAELIERELARQEEELVARQESVVRMRFERWHRRREMELQAQHRRKRVKDTYHAYKSDIEGGLVDKHDEQQANVAQVRSARQEQRAKAAARKDDEFMRSSFVARQNAIAKTCRTMDYRNFKAHQTARAQHNADTLRERWAVRKSLLEGRHLLSAAQRQMQDATERQQTEYLLRKRHENEARSLQESKMQIKAIRDLDTQMKEAQLEAVQLEDSQDSEDVVSYNRTLSAFRELTSLVQEHGGRMQAAIDGLSSKRAPGDEGGEEETEKGEEAEHPLFAVEPMVRQALGRVGEELFVNVSQQETSGFSPTLGSEQASSPGPQGESDEDASPHSGNDLQSFPSSPATKAERSPMPMLPQLTTTSTKPVRSARAPAQLAEKPQGPQPVLSVQPLHSLKSYFTGAGIPRPSSSRARREAQNLAALRQARSGGGSFSARGPL